MAETPERDASEIVAEWLALPRLYETKSTVTLRHLLEARIADALRAERERAEKAEREAEEFQRKGESLCAWIGVLLTSLVVSTPEEGVAKVEALAHEEERLRHELQECHVSCMQWQERAEALTHERTELRRQLEQIARGLRPRGPVPLAPEEG